MRHEGRRQKNEHPSHLLYFPFFTPLAPSFAPSLVTRPFFFYFFFPVVSASLKTSLIPLFFKYWKVHTHVLLLRIQTVLTHAQGRRQMLYYDYHIAVMFSQPTITTQKRSRHRSRLSLSLDYFYHFSPSLLSLRTFFSP